MAGIALAKFRVAFDAWHEPLVARRAVQSESEVCAVLRETYGANDCMNQLLLEHVDARAWRAPVQERKTSGKDARLPEFSPICTTIACADKNSAPHLKCPAPLDPARLHHQTDTRSSSARCGTMPGDAEGREEVGRQAGLREQRCSVTCSRTRRITEGRRSCWHIPWDTSCRTKPRMGFGDGGNFGSSAVLRPGQGDWQVARTSTRKSQQTSAYLET